MRRHGGEGTPVFPYLGFELRYAADLSALPPRVASCFVASGCDAGTQAFIDGVLERRPGFFRRAAHRMLLRVVSDFDADGTVGMYPMHLLGQAQWHALLEKACVQRHLDVGAGSGDVTQAFATLSSEIVTTETSRAMAKKLTHRGFRCVRTDVAETGVPEPPYDRISCLNVLDRCKQPLTLLGSLLSALAPGGELVLATPLPFRPFYYEGANTYGPREHLPINGSTWEEGVTELFAVLEPLGLDLRKVTRAPYLSGGDGQQSLYVLDDAIFIYRRTRKQTLA